MSEANPIQALRPFRIRDIKETRIIQGAKRKPVVSANKSYDVILVQSTPEGIYFGIVDENNQLCWVEENECTMYIIPMSFEGSD